MLEIFGPKISEDFDPQFFHYEFSTSSDHSSVDYQFKYRKNFPSL